MFSMGPAESSWDYADRNVQQALPQQSVTEQSSSVSEMRNSQNTRDPLAASRDQQRPFSGGTPPPSSATSAQCSRYSAMDFELHLHEGKTPTDDMRRSSAYVKWYTSKKFHDNRIPPPLLDLRQSAGAPLETPWEDGSAAHMMGPHGMTGQVGAAVPEAGKGNFRLELDAKNLQQVHDLQTFNPYFPGVQQHDDNMLSPGTQFFGAYAPTPLATTATPNTLRAYAHSCREAQNRGNTTGSTSSKNPANPESVLRPSSQIPQGAVYGNEWNNPGDFSRNPVVVDAISQQYYTQEPMNPFEYYGEHAMGGYYGALAAGAVDAARMHSALLPMETAPGEMPAMRGGGGGGRGRRGGGRGGRGGGRWNANGSNGAGAGGGGGGGGVAKSGGGRGGGGGSGAYREAQQPCSELLGQFRSDAVAGATDHWRFTDIVGYAIEFAQDQEGSRFIQRAVDTATHDEVDSLFREIFEFPLDLVTDIFGNYVLQKLLEIGNARQLAYAATRLQNNVVSLTLQTYGCRVIQKCIEVMPPEGLDIILGELKGNVAKCIQDQNGNHVVQKCVEIIPQRCGFIVSAFSGRVKELATHAYGCRVIQCIMEHCPDQEEAIFSELLECVGTLAKDQYGNYVIQHVLQHVKDENKVERVFKALKENFYEFSKQKFASNVMEKVFSRASPQQRMELVHMMCSPVPGLEEPKVDVVTFKRSAPTKKENVEKSRGEFAKKGRRDREKEREKENAGGVVVEVKTDGKESPSMLCLMMQNPFANYVVQRVLDVADVEQFWSLIDGIQKFILPIGTYTYGSPIVQRLARRELIRAPDDASLNLSASGSGSHGGKHSHHNHRKPPRDTHNES